MTTKNRKCWATITISFLITTRYFFNQLNAVSGEIPNEDTIIQHIIVSVSNEPFFFFKMGTRRSQNLAFPHSRQGGGSLTATGERLTDTVSATGFSFIHQVM